MSSALADISDTLRVSAGRRPRRSANRPSSQPPTGRMKKPTAKMAAVFSSCAVASPWGKNAAAK